MNLKLIFASFCILLMSKTHSQAIGDFPINKDIGNPKLEGSAKFDVSTQTYNIKAGGANIWDGRDEFRYLFDTVAGDFILTADVEILTEDGDPHRKAGLMIRASETENSAHMCATYHGNGDMSMQWRELEGALMRNPEDEIIPPKFAYQTLQLERKGNKFIMRAAHPGEPLQYIGSHKLSDIPDTMLAGIFVCSHDADNYVEAKIWNVRIERPVPAEYNAYTQGQLGCKMEIMNVFDGVRTVIHEDTKGFEAPNWKPDGKNLIFNQGGLIYTLPVAGGTPTQINTGDVVRNNNDHVLSWGGKQLAISSSSEGFSSRIYVLPVEGGTPRLITKKAPSYLHGWSKNNKEIVYTAQRDGKPYNLYKARVSDGLETQLTFNEGLTDGPEYSPDGGYIYYNGTQSGTMQLWRMNTDGSDPVQLTFDEYNNWFPHISPDNKWIVFISFPKTIPVEGHPFYKRVMLRLMPVSGGAPKVIAYLHGGQGTINVPSWSPDSKRIAFVSNTGKR